ncbi:hypothetical protein AVDCRST_MAG94-4457 [uncultured Leptolyngbya sp.]|uniref:Uncharacterized protein n=1 Tax=uncultured Leptolyngbya sp. TaxID=332963 RepID=A0A6J4N109_9CYAN|nr:hypothetical protein AVDCRST_MAG94-4457 [uncultured Leptolyngbya sp.]
MPASEAQKRAIEKYAQSEKGRAALQRAHSKRADTKEYREYQRQKQAEYRRRKKESLATTAKQGHPEPQGNQVLSQDVFAPVSEDTDKVLSELDRLIGDFREDLLSHISQQALSYNSLPLAYRVILDALDTWKADYR